MKKMILICLVYVFCPSIMMAQDEYDVYLMIGQSNMAGRAGILSEDRGVMEGVFLLDEKGEIVPAQLPFNIYSTVRKQRSMQRFGLTNVFAREVHRYTGRKILLVVNARGETRISNWVKSARQITFDKRYGDDRELWGRQAPQLYNEAVRRTRQAMQYGKLKGIIWHQGEGDSMEPYVWDYVVHLEQLVSDLRADLGVGEDVPFVLGQVSTVAKRADMINPELSKAARKIPNAYCVSSKACDTLHDNVHFSRDGYIKIGKRYARYILKKVYGIKVKQ